MPSSQRSRLGVQRSRLIHAGGIPQKNEALNRIYANVLNKPVLVPERPITSLGSAIFACVAAGLHGTIEDAQRALCPPYRIVNPDPAAVAVYDRIFPMFRSLYFAMGDPRSASVEVGAILPALRSIAAEARRAAAP